MGTPASHETSMSARITLDFRHTACCSGPCNKTAPLRDSEPGQYRWDGLMYAGHSHTLYVVRGYQCSACYRRYREFWEAFDWAVEKKDYETMFSIEEWFECDFRAITSKFKSMTPGAVHHLCDSESSDSQPNPSTPPALGTIYEERIKNNSVYLPVFTHHAARQRMHALQKIGKRRRHGNAPSAPSRHERRRLRYA